MTINHNRGWEVGLTPLIIGDLTNKSNGEHATALCGFPLQRSGMFVVGQWLCEVPPLQRSGVFVVGQWLYEDPRSSGAECL